MTLDFEFGGREAKSKATDSLDIEDEDEVEVPRRSTEVELLLGDGGSNAEAEARSVEDPADIPGDQGVFRYDGRRFRFTRKYD